MKLLRHSSPRCRNRGLSLIELLVSLVIGLVIMIAVVSAYIGASGATRVAEAQARMNEDAQAALTILSQQLRMAGNNPKQPNYEAGNNNRNPVYAGGGTYIVRGCDGRFSDVTSAASIQTLTCAAGGGAAPDSIALTYEADRYNTVPTAGGVPTDCLGQALPIVTFSPNVWNGAASVPTIVTYTIAENRFYLGTSTSVQAPSLFCKGNGAAASQSLVENVEDLQFVYGTAPATATPSTLAVAGYLSAAEVLSTPTLAALPDDPSRWAQVMTVRLCVVVRSERPVATDLDSARYVKCDGTVDTNPPDLRLRRAYSTTVVLRNRVPS